MPDPAPTGRRQRSKLDKERRIREAALALFRAKGFEHTTTKEIADQAGIATGTLFLYVKDKHELLFWVWRERIEHTLDRAGARLPAESTLVDAWMHYFEALFRLYHQDEELARHFIREQMFRASNERDAAQLGRFFGELAGLVEQAQRRGEVAATASPLMAAQTAFLLYLGGLIRWLGGVHTQREALDDLRAHLSQQFDGLRA